MAKVFVINVGVKMNGIISHGMHDALFIRQLEIEELGFFSIEINTNNPAFIEALILGPTLPPQGRYLRTKADR